MYFKKTYEIIIYASFIILCLGRSQLDKEVHNVKEKQHIQEWKRLATEQEERSNDEIKILRFELQEERAKVLELSKKVKEFQKEKDHLLVR